MHPNLWSTTYANHLIKVFRLGFLFVVIACISGCGTAPVQKTTTTILGGGYVGKKYPAGIYRWDNSGHKVILWLNVDKTYDLEDRLKNCEWDDTTPSDSASFHEKGIWKYSDLQLELIPQAQRGKFTATSDLESMHKMREISPGDGTCFVSSDPQSDFCIRTIAYATDTGEIIGVEPTNISIESVTSWRDFLTGKYVWSEFNHNLSLHLRTDKTYSIQEKRVYCVEPDRDFIAYHETGTWKYSDRQLELMPLEQHGKCTMTGAVNYLHHMKKVCDGNRFVALVASDSSTDFCVLMYEPEADNPSESSN